MTSYVEEPPTRPVQMLILVELKQFCVFQLENCGELTNYVDINQTELNFLKE